MWHQLVVDIKTLKEAELVLNDLLSETETEAVTKRLAVGYWLVKKRSYENIRQNLKVSSATIATIQHELKKPGWKEAMRRVMAEEWATRAEEKIKQWFNFRREN